MNNAERMNAPTFANRRKQITNSFGRESDVEDSNIFKKFTLLIADSRSGWMGDVSACFRGLWISANQARESVRSTCKSLITCATWSVAVRELKCSMHRRPVDFREDFLRLQKRWSCKKVNLHNGLTRWFYLYVYKVFQLSSQECKCVSLYRCFRSPIPNALLKNMRWSQK